MNIEIKSPGESPINWRLQSFPSDAKRVLWMRSKIREHMQANQIEGPVSDLVAEQELLDTDSYFGMIHGKVNQPIAFSLPTPILKVLSLL